MLGYFAALVERRRSEPADDTISHLLAAGVGEAGDDAGLLSILAFAFTMVAGGNDTTTGLLGGAVQLLAADPGQRALLAADPSLVPDAVEELLRLTSPVQGLARTTTRDVEVAGVTVPAGRKVLLLYAAANRDPRRYGPDAEKLDVRLRVAVPAQHGIVLCLGCHHCDAARAGNVTRCSERRQVEASRGPPGRRSARSRRSGRRRR